MTSKFILKYVNRILGSDLEKKMIKNDIDLINQVSNTIKERYSDKNGDLNKRDLLKLETFLSIKKEDIQYMKDLNIPNKVVNFFIVNLVYILSFKFVSEKLEIFISNLLTIESSQYIYIISLFIISFIYFAVLKLFSVFYDNKYHNQIYTCNVLINLINDLIKNE